MPHQPILFRRAYPHDARLMIHQETRIRVARNIPERNPVPQLPAEAEGSTRGPSVPRRNELLSARKPDQKTIPSH